MHQSANDSAMKLTQCSLNNDQQQKAPPIWKQPEWLSRSQCDFSPESRFFLARQAISDDEIDGYHIPAKSSVVLSLM